MQESIFKICNQCKKALSLENFKKRREGKFGVVGKCNLCLDFNRNYNLPLVKTCSRCKLELPISDFSKSNSGRSKYGLSCFCRACANLRYVNNRDSILENQKLRQQRINNDPILHKKDLEYKRNYYKDNTEKCIKYQKNYQNRNKELVAIRSNIYKLKKYHNDPLHRFSSRIKTCLRENYKRVGLSKKGRTFSILGYSKEDLYNHLFKYLNKPCECCTTILTDNPRNYNIEHIVPLCSANTELDIIRLNQLSNLRLLCKVCNNKKIRSDLKLRV